jgi:uncharacterized membrane protein
MEASTMEARQTESALRDIARRLDHIEDVLGIRAEPAAEDTPSRPAEADEAEVHDDVAAVSLPQEAAENPIDDEPADTQAPPAWKPAPATPISIPPEPQWERLIAERWLAWAGAVVVVLAVGFFVKMAYDLGWIGALPPAAKCGIAALFGLALTAAGEVSLRKVGRAAAASLFGAGLGTLYLTAYASFRYFQLVPAAGAFWLMFLVAVLGVAITVRGRLLAVGVLALIGGYLSPVLMYDQPSFPAALPMYTTCLLGIALALAAIWAASFRALRYVALAMHLVLAMIWVHTEGLEHWLLALTFLTIWWGMVLAEALYAATRGQSEQGNAVVVLIMTIAYAIGGCGTLAAAEPGSHDLLGLFMASVALACTLNALLFGPGLAGLRAQPRSALHTLVVTLWIQVGLLLVVAVGLQFRTPGTTFGQTIGWLAVAVACAEMARWVRSRGVLAFGLIVGVLALVRIWGPDRQTPMLQSTLGIFAGIDVTGWSLLAAGAIAATALAAIRSARLRTAETDALAKVLLILAAVQWMILCGMQCGRLSVTVGWLLAAVALSAPPQDWARLLAARAIAVALLIAAAAKWLLYDTLLVRGAPSYAPTDLPLLANTQFALALGVIVAGAAIGYRFVRDARREGVAEALPVPWQVWCVCLALFCLVALSFEVERAVHLLGLKESAGRVAWEPWLLRLLALMPLWSGGGLAAIIWGRQTRWSAPAIAGWWLVVGSSVAWLWFGTIWPRLLDGPTLALPVLNVQCLVGVVLLAILITAGRVIRRAPDRCNLLAVSPAIATRTLIALALLAGLWIVSLEIDRIFAPEAERFARADMLRQTALSVHWGVYAAALIGIGLWRRSAGIRYGGLALLVVTLAKVLIVDLAHVDYFYRVLSLLVVGLLAIGASVAYARSFARSGPGPLART